MDLAAGERKMISAGWKIRISRFDKREGGGREKGRKRRERVREREGRDRGESERERRRWSIKISSSLLNFGGRREGR